MKKLVTLEPGIIGFKDHGDREIEESEVRIRVIFVTLKPGTEIVDFRELSPFIDEESSEKWRLLLSREEGSQRGMVFSEFQLGNVIVSTIEGAGSLVTEYRKGELVYTYELVREMPTISGADNCKLRRLDRLDQRKNAVCYDPAQFALGGIREVHVQAGDTVAIFGLDVIGQTVVQLVKKAGVTTIVGVDLITQRRRLAKKYDADYMLDPTKADAGFHPKELIDRHGVDSIIEADGGTTVLQASLGGVDYGEIISYVAFAKPLPAEFNLGCEAHFNNAKIVFARASSEPNPDYPKWNRKRIEGTCWGLLMDGYLDCEEIVDPVVPSAENAEVYMRYVSQHPEESIEMSAQVREGEQ